MHHARICQANTPRHGGFPPTLTDEEVITIEICGEYFKCGTDKDLFAHFHTHYAGWFPHLTDRTNTMQVIDTVPLPVCTYTRSRRDRCFKTLADYGYCVAKELHYYGFKLGLRASRAGMITWFPLFAARPHDIQFLSELTEGFAGTVPADKGFIDATRQVLLAARHGVLVVTPPRKGMTTPHPRAVLKICARWRKCVEAVDSHLTERFAMARIRVHDLWHYQQRVSRKMLAHTVGVFLNLRLGRSPLDLDGLVAG